MAKIELPKAAQEPLARALAKYLKDELDVEVAGFDAVFLLDFIVERIGPHIYNQGVADAQALLGKKAELMVESLSELEKVAKL